MVRTLGIPLLFVSFIGGAYAQTATTTVRAATPETVAAAKAAARNIAPGTYAGRVQDEGGSTRYADVKINIRNVTPDARVTATVETTHTRAACAKRLPLNGIVLPEGLMRLTVDDGAPEGCERIYHVKVAPGGAVSGTFIDGKPAARNTAGVLK